MNKITLPCILGLAALARPVAAPPADHNDPNAVNGIFSDVDVSAADLYDMFGWPSDDARGGEKVVLALTFASVPRSGVLDQDMLYKIKVEADPRSSLKLGPDCELSDVQAHLAALADKFLNLRAAEVRVRVDAENRARVEFLDFAGGSFERELSCNETHSLMAPDGSTIQVFVGGRDDAFFNDLPGFFRSINYAPQFYRVPLAQADMRELAIPKTLLELEGNDLFNFDPRRPEHGQGLKLELPPGAHALTGAPYKKDANGDFRFVYSGKDAQAGMDVNAIVLEIPLAFITRDPEHDRVVNAWGESWVLKASAKVADIRDDGGWIAFLATRSTWLILAAVLLAALFLWRARSAARRGPRVLAGVAGALAMVVGVGLAVYARSVAAGNDLFLRSEAERDPFMRDYKLVDTDGVPFADAGLCERENGRQRGANNVPLGLHFVKRFAHLGWGFGPSISALGLSGSFDHGGSPISVHKEVTDLVDAFARTRRALFQPLNMPDGSWNKRGLAIPLRSPFEIFVPNVNSIDMDTTGTWPFGRRLEDQVATRFLSTFLDMSAEWNGRPYHLDLLGQQELWDAAPIQPKTPPNPLANDRPFLSTFPYLAEPWNP